MSDIAERLEEIMETSDELQELLHDCLFETLDSIAVERFKNALKNELDSTYEVDDFHVSCVQHINATTEFVASSSSLNLSGSVIVSITPQLSFE